MHKSAVLGLVLAAAMIACVAYPATAACIERDDLQAARAILKKEGVKKPLPRRTLIYARNTACADIRALMVFIVEELKWTDKGYSVDVPTARLVARLQRRAAMMTARIKGLDAKRSTKNPIAAKIVELRLDQPQPQR